MNQNQFATQYFSVNTLEAIKILKKSQKLLSNCPDGHFLQTQEEYMRECYETAEQIERVFEKVPPPEQNTWLLPPPT